ncbi:hypothetical protein [Rathayibacter sp. VKM Ac-2760]|uniref:Acg family FMN-binding oxidoreductase n=1 Tax=Rathayibacter sp. VKM Ac-2760 TaxID=2609253 RepID=UPI00131695A4|nr:hypothetical protein [Rathayibacter sp. VKM Ac-2760]QHC60966.1 hypothetical protein GSU72_19755 [Rathayibacter sp. VKM Ac-2760]
MTTVHEKTPHRLRRGIVIAAGSTVGVGAALLVVVLAAGGLFARADYLDPWEQSYADTFEDPRMQLVAQAVLAPSSHNEQPWKIELDGSGANAFSLFADSSRLTPEVDPLARQTMISQGTFLEYLRVAGAAAGYEVGIEMFPGGDYDEAALSSSMDERPVARVTLRVDSPAPSSDHAALFLSDTNRSPYSPTAVTSAQTDELESLVAAGGASLTVFRDDEDVSVIRAATVRGSVIEAGNAAVAAESAAVFRSNEYVKNEYRSGFAVEGQGTSGVAKYLLQGIATLLPGSNGSDAAATRDIALATDGAASTSAYAIVTTAENTRADQVEAGMLYASFALRARALGLVTQPVSQILEEHPAMELERASIHDAYAPEGATIQMLARLGTATVDYPPTMRRDANDLLGAE